MRGSVAAGALLALLCVAASARAAAAPTAADVQQQARFDAGNAYYDAGEYDRALAEFKAAYEVQHHPDILINIATTYERLYRPAKAREAYEAFLASSAPAGSELRKLADKRLKVLRVLPGSITVDVGMKAEVILTGAGGEQRGESPVTFGELAPGQYHVRAQAKGYLPIDRDVTLVPGMSPVITDPIQRERETITLFSEPDGARVFIDNQDTGEVTPFSRLYDVGPHVLRLELPDRKPWMHNVTLVGGAPVFHNVRMAPPPHSGRTEMMLAAMLFGGYAAPALAVSIGGTRLTTGNNLLILLPVGVAGVGVGALSWLLTDDDMKVGHSSIIIGGTFWGGLAGASLAFGLGLTGNDQRFTQQNTLALSLLGGGLGLGAGILTARLNDTSAGDAALVNSGAFWGTAATALLTEAISFRKPDHDPALGWLTLGGNVLGLTTGALLARGLEVSRAHVAVVDAAAFVGTVLGYGIGYAAGKSEEDGNSGTVCLDANGRCVSGARYALGGMALALLVAAPLVGRLPFEVPKSEALLQRHNDRWALGLPAVRLGAAITPRGMDQQLVLDLARGEW